MRREAQASPVMLRGSHRAAASRRTVWQRFFSAGPRFSAARIEHEPRLSQLLAGTLSGPERSPGTARVRACEARPQAPHPAPPYERLRTAPLSEQAGVGILFYRNFVKPLSSRVGLIARSNS